MLTLNEHETDNSEFVQIISRLVSNLRERFLPKEIYVVQIDNWFDYKWLGFTGKALGALGLWHGEFRVPPFRPNRVLGQMVWERDSVITSYDLVSKPNLHLEQTSEKNHYRLINRVTTSGLFIWYSGQTAVTNRGSIMVYQVDGLTVDGWYAGFQNTDGWSIKQTKRIAKQQLHQWLQPAEQNQETS